MEFKYSIIDSDATSNLQLQHFLEEYDDLSYVSLSKNSTDGLNSILKYSPDIVFINLNENTSECFGMATELHQYVSNMPVFIGISKTKAHAYDAIKNGFFDYWLMPYNEFEIRKSLLRLKKTISLPSPFQPEPKKLCLKTYSDFQYLDTEEILYLQADNNATKFIMKDGTVTNAFKTLKTFEGQMPKNFVRIHQSYIVNTHFISGINYGKSVCSLNLRNLRLPFSKSYKPNVDYLKKSLSKNSVLNMN